MLPRVGLFPVLSRLAYTVAAITSPLRTRKPKHLPGYSSASTENKTSTMSQFDGTECANPGCRHREKPIPKRYKCCHCGCVLHNSVLSPTCSVASPEGDGKTECLPHVGCQSPKRAASDAKPSVESSQGTDEDCSFNYLDSDDDDDLKIVSTKKVGKTDYFPESDLW